MAIAIKSIPTLENKSAQSFVKRAESSVKKKGTVNFSKQLKSARNILYKAKIK